ncbi:MAG: response regulator [Phycisphaerae bacterium]
MANVQIDILLIEDDREQVQHLREKLVLADSDAEESALSAALLRGGTLQDPSADITFRLHHESTLSEALKSLTRGGIDVILLDLGLPDSDGLGTLEAVYSQVPEIPIVVLTGPGDAELAIRAMGNGAEDFLLKDSTDRNTLVRALRYATQRHRMLRRMERERQRELASLARLTSSGFPSVTARYFGAQALVDSAPGTFNELVQAYEELLEHTLENQTHDTQRDLSGEVRLLARRLGFFKAGPRDAVLIHTTALKRKKSTGNVRRTQAYAQEGRYLLLELMGYMVSFYQKYAMGAVRPTPDPRDREGTNPQEWPE